MEVFQRIKRSTWWVGGLEKIFDFSLMSDKLKDMREITTRELQQHTRSVRERLESGETLQWTLRGRVVAHLTPAIKQGKTSDWPDPLERLRSIYGSAAEGGEASASDRIYRDRG